MAGTTPAPQTTSTTQTPKTSIQDSLCGAPTIDPKEEGKITALAQHFRDCWEALIKKRRDAGSTATDTELLVDWSSVGLATLLMKVQDQQRQINELKDQILKLSPSNTVATIPAKG